jgi:membrane protein insertase Oxa1/YidC/SpoIIIJ
MESIDISAQRSGTLRYRRLLALATIMSIVVIAATISALASDWYAHVRTYRAQEQKGDREEFILNRTINIWNLEARKVTLDLPLASYTDTEVYEPFSKTASIIKVAQGFDLIALFIAAGLHIFLVSCFSRAIRTKLFLLLGARLIKILPVLMVFSIGCCLMIASIGFLGINKALDMDGFTCECTSSFAKYQRVIVGTASFENPHRHTMENVDLLRVDDWGPQAGWFLTLLQIPFVFVMLYSVFFNQAPLPVDHFALADPL